MFNRFTGGRIAIVEDTPGVTRDRLYRDADWLDRTFTVVDTGGIETGNEDKMIEQIKTQAEIAIEEADVILFVIDGRVGITSEDQEITQLLRKTNKEIVLVVNKIEDYSDPTIFYEFYSLGLGEPNFISAAHGMNIGDLLDNVVSKLPKQDGENIDPDTIMIAVAGRPNVGKSSLVNTLLGRERVIVSDVAGTTRDAIDTKFVRDDQEYVIVDTAGMRRRGKIYDNTEKYSVVRALRAIDRSDVVLLVMDAVDGITEQDKKVIGYAHEQGRGCILVINKWDLIEKDDKSFDRYEKKIRNELLFMQYAPIIFVSALTKQRTDKIIEIVNFVAEQQTNRVSTSALNEVITEATQLNPPPSDKGKRLKILYSTQVGIKPPTFIFFVNDPKIMHFSYRRYLENKIRDSFGFQGTPIRLVVRKKSE